MNMYHMCDECGNVFEVDRAAEQGRYNYERTFRCPIPIDPRCQGTVKWLKEEDAQRSRRKILPLCSQCNQEYTDIWLAESLTQAPCATCRRSTTIKWVKVGSAAGYIWLVIAALALAAFLCYKFLR